MTPLDADRAYDRRRLKRGLVFWRLLAILLVVGLGLALLARFDVFDRGAYVAQLDVVGPIVGDRDRDQRLREIAADPRARALIVHIDSPGGTVVGGENLYRNIRRVAANKPVVAVMGNLATSAAYMTAIAGDRIYAGNGTVTGSIGVILQTADITEMLSSLGVRMEAIKSSPLKAQPSPFEKLDDKARETTQEVVDDIYAMFVDMVADRRDLTLDRTRDLSDGRVYTGRQAVTLGLVDEIGDVVAARQWLADKHDVSLDIPARPVVDEDEAWGWIEGQAGAKIGKLLFSERLSLDGLLSVWHPDD